CLNNPLAHYLDRRGYPVDREAVFTHFAAHPVERFIVAGACSHADLVDAATLFTATQHSSPPSSPDAKKPSKRNLATDGKKNRFKATEEELPILSAVFEKNPFPSGILRQKLADRLGLESKQIQTIKINGMHVIMPKTTNAPSVL
ncbi:hypothetical protein HDU98_003536, partial [Podochytrium sp. JEL0797]